MMMVISGDGEKIIFCPYCHTLSNAYFLFNGRSYYHCPSCDLIFAKHENDGEAVIAYYQDCYFDENTEDQISGQRTDIYRHLLNLLEKNRKCGSLLDIGCGCGFFLNEAKARGWKVCGIDPSRKSVDYARSLIGDTVICGTLDDLPTGRQYDAITLINVLDHMVDPFRQLQKVRALLASDGILYLRFPNAFFHSFFMRLSGMILLRQFINSFLIFHEYAFTPRAIHRCLNDMGFANIRVVNSHLTGFNFGSFGREFGKLTGKIISHVIFLGGKLLEILSGGRWAWGPSLQVIAKKGTGDRKT
jgi:2-polyprenyl-3-methyl-5-hydroxy-6-metoxy-1,4-benzoquinol methylase